MEEHAIRWAEHEREDLDTPDDTEHEREDLDTLSELTKIFLKSIFCYSITTSVKEKLQEYIIFKKRCKSDVNI